MKLIVAGSRSIRDKQTVREAIEDADLLFGPVDEIIHGGAKGVDSLADGIAHAKGFPTVTTVKPDYDKWDPKYAPLKRNRRMAEKGDALVAVWDGESTGTRHMIEQALAHGLDVLVKQV